jgi:hypothetical protein
VAHCQRLAWLRLDGQNHSALASELDERDGSIQDDFAH